MIRHLILILILTPSLAFPAIAGLNKDSKNSTFDDFNTSYREVRQDFLSHAIYSLKVDGHDYVCDIPQTLRRLGGDGEEFRIKKIKTKRDHFRIEMETRGKTRLTIRAYDRSKLSQEFLDQGLVRLLSDIFEYGDPPAPVQFVGHIESNLLHLDRCNHLPKLELRRVFKTAEEASTEGYRECPICFGNTENLPLRGYLGSRVRGLQDARLFELVYPPSQDQELQDWLDRLGEEVISNWPMELSGFEYDFRVIQADQPLAVSFGTGIVMLSDTMLLSADAEEEILFVLAHEIAHCELHLPPRSPYAGVRFGGPLDPGYARYWVWASSQQLTADLMAVAWFQGLPSGERDLSQAKAALAKVQHASGATDQVSLEYGQSTGLHQRLWLFEPARFHPGDPKRVFTAYDGEEDARYEVRFLGLQKDEEENNTNVYFLFTTTDYQEKPVSPNNQNYDGAIRDVQRKETRFSIQPFQGVPGFSTILMGQTRSKEYFDKFTPGPLLKVVINGLDGVKNWRIPDSEETSYQPGTSTGLR